MLLGSVSPPKMIRLSSEVWLNLAFGIFFALPNFGTRLGGGILSLGR
jgi:hypothetical protein